MDRVVALGDVGSRDLLVAGGKGANLGELIRAGFDVPAGFVVTADAYADAVRDVALAEDAGATRLAIESADVPAATADAIRLALAALGGGAVAVRSSATAEDLPGAAFAGQQDTFLNVLGADAVVDAVRSCWASLFTDRAVEYRRRLGLDQAAVRIAVVVQRMVDADWAGVMFTADPVTGSRTRTVIDASPGLGEAVVSGLVTPDHLVVERRRVLEHRAGLREVVIRPAVGGGVEHENGPTRPFRTADAVALASVGTLIADHFERPMDIEWAIAGSALHILQARPLTALPPAPIRVGPLRRLVGRTFIELLPIRPFPLDMSTWTVRGHGRILSRMMLEIPGIRVDIDRMLPEVDGVVDQFVPARIRPTLRTLSAPMRSRRRIERFRPERWTLDPRFAEFEEHIGRLRAIDTGAASWEALTTVPNDALETLDLFIDIRIDYLPRAGFDLVRLRLLLTALSATRYFAPLVIGGRTRTADANAALEVIAAGIRGEPGWRAAFETLDPGDLHEVIAGRSFARLRAAIDGYLDEYGHRETTSAFLMSEPTFGEDRRVILGVLKSTLGMPPPPAVDGAPSAESRVTELRRVRFTRAGDLVVKLARSARAGLAFREDTHFHAMRPLPILRGALLETGRRLADAGVLERSDDVLHLRLEEIDRLGEPLSLDSATIARLRATVRQRAARRAEFAGSPLVAHSTLYRSPRHPSDALVSGTPAGGGRITGSVRVIRSPEEFGRLAPGEILVCPYTNPSWTPLFQVASAVVVDTGGLGSHAAIVAREYGIPAVMGTGNGSTVLEDGRSVTVDGDAGLVLAG